MAAKQDDNEDAMVENACSALKKAKYEGYGLLVMTGAGMSVSSSVPVFRNADGSMSDEFLGFLGDYNTARARHGLPQAEDWFDFSVPEMFRDETSREAWAYWRWRILRAQVEPSQDYQDLSRIIDSFGDDKSFVVTSNCDGLHKKGGVDDSKLKEIHGSLSRVQCSIACSYELWPVDEKFVSRLRNEPDWIPICPNCHRNCLRPNVMIFGDDMLVHRALSEQNRKYAAFKRKCQRWIVLEIGAGVVVASIRYEAEALANKGSGGLIRINPSRDECDEMQTDNNLMATSKYWPVAAESSDVLKPLADAVEA